MWKIIKKIFATNVNKREIVHAKIEITFDEFLNEELVKKTLRKLQKPAIVLNPRKAASNKNFKSKMGGEPNLNNFEFYPICDSCGSPLNFVLQLDKQEFPEFYWPDNKITFQLFRCPNYDCSEASSEKYDLKMFHFYSPYNDNTDRLISKPNVEIVNREAEVKECLFHREIITDYSFFNSETYDEHKKLQESYCDDLIDEFDQKYNPKQRTKIMGYPSFTQNPFYPTCTCGKEKEFFFQLSSEDNDGNEHSKDFSDNDYWSHHGIMIGDVGNIYYYVCKDCGEQTIESYWDCC